MIARLGDIIENMPTEIRVRALKTFAAILNVEDSEQDNRILTQAQEWFTKICKVGPEDEPLKWLFSLCKQPFADIRQAALQVLVVVASQTWGQEYISRTPEVIKFLLDRKAESYKECKEAKYDVIAKLANAPAGIFENFIMRRFKEFVVEGPHFVEIQHEVGWENAM